MKKLRRVSLPSTVEIDYLADALTAGIAAVLPWSTSATSILSALWVFVSLLCLGRRREPAVLCRPAAWVPLAFAMAGALGIAWANVTWQQAFGGLSSYAKFLAIPLLMVQFYCTGRARWVYVAFLLSCGLLLLASVVPEFIPGMRWVWREQGGYPIQGVPVRDYIIQSEEFLLCVFGLLYVAHQYFRSRRHLMMLGCGVLATIFAYDMAYLATSRTVILIAPLFSVVLSAKLYGWRGVGASLIVLVGIGCVLWVSSPYLRLRLTSIGADIYHFQENVPVAAHERLQFWDKSLTIIEQAPWFGHGTGSILNAYEKLNNDEHEKLKIVTTNPHNQILAVGIQLGAFGVAVLLGMWSVHLLVFLGASLEAWVGLLVVLENLIGCLFNSHLFDFAQGWLYVVGVGVSAGAVFRERSGIDNSATKSAAETIV